MEELTDDEMYLLLGKVTGTLTPGEELAVEALLRERPPAREAYHALAATYADRTAEPDWTDIPTLLRQGTEQRQMPVRRMIWRRWVAAAAIAVLLSASYFLWRQALNTDTAAPRLAAKPTIELKLGTGETIDLSKQRGNITVGGIQFDNTGNALSFASGEHPGSVGHSTLTVPIGLDYKITLADGTEVWLNSATRLDFPVAFKGGTREITIDGEAYLNVAKDTQRPFIVHLPDSRVEVLGTEFNVNTYDPGVEKVALVSGAVRVETPPVDGVVASLRILPGEQFTYTSRQPATVDTFDARDVLSWREGRYYFREATLEEISRVVPRWYGIKVSIDDPAILSRRFTGVIDRKQPIGVFLEDLNAISGIKGYVDSEGLLHFGR